MARQPKTAKPKTKFSKTYRCTKCGFATNDYRLATFRGALVIVCKKYPDCTPTPMTV